MADKAIIEAEVKSNIGEVADGVDKAAKSTENLAKQTDKVGDASAKSVGGVKKLTVGFKTLAKASGIVFLLNKAFEVLQEVFSSNQKVLDGFNTGMTALNMAFNDLFNFLSENIGAFQGFFKSIFEDPQQALKDFGDIIQNNLIEKFNSLLDTYGYVGSALGALLKGNFKEAGEFAKMAGKEMVDVVTGVDNAFDKTAEAVTTAADAVVDYSKKTWKAAAAVTATQKAAEKAAVEFAKLNAQYLKDAEVQRQIRDDETKTFAERIAANEELSRILAEQQEKQKEQVQLQIAAAQAQYDINQSDANWIALQQEKVAMLELEETITGQLSEQKTNQVALEKELLEAQNEIRAEGMSGMQRELQELEAAYNERIRLANKAGMKTTAIEKQFSKQKSAIIKEQVNSQLSAASGLAGALGKLAGDNKELAVASAIIDTYVGANKALAQGGIAGFVGAAAVIATGIANVKTIMEQDTGSGSGGGGGSAAAQAPAPQMMSGAFDLTGGVEPEATRAYVVTDEMSNSQNQLANIRRRATI